MTQLNPGMGQRTGLHRPTTHALALVAHRGLRLRHSRTRGYEDKLGQMMTRGCGPPRPRSRNRCSRTANPVVVLRSLSPRWGCVARKVAVGAAVLYTERQI